MELNDEDSHLVLFRGDSLIIAGQLRHADVALMYEIYILILMSIGYSKKQWWGKERYFFLLYLKFKEKVTVV